MVVHPAPVVAFTGASPRDLPRMEMNAAGLAPMLRWEPTGPDGKTEQEPQPMETEFRPFSSIDLQKTYKVRPFAKVLVPNPALNGRKS